MMEHNFVAPAGFTPDMGIPAYFVCDPCGKHWWAAESKPTGSCSKKRGGNNVAKLKNRSGDQRAIQPETRELSRSSMASLSVMSAPRGPGERDAFVLGLPDQDVWYAEHAYRAITPWGAMRFGSAGEAWSKLSELTGKRRPDVYAVRAQVARERRMARKGLTMSTKEQ